MILCIWSSAGPSQEPLPYNFFKWAPAGDTGMDSETEGSYLHTQGCKRCTYKDVRHSPVYNREKLEII